MLYSLIALCLFFAAALYLQNRMWRKYVAGLKLSWRQVGHYHFVRCYEGITQKVAEIDNTRLDQSNGLYLLHYATIDDKGAAGDWLVISEDRFLHNISNLRDASDWVAHNKPGETVRVRLARRGKPSYLAGINSMDEWQDLVFFVVNKAQLALYRHRSRSEYLLIWAQNGTKCYTICNESDLYERQKAALRGAFEKHLPHGCIWHTVA